MWKKVGSRCVADHRRKGARRGVARWTRTHRRDPRFHRGAQRPCRPATAVAPLAVIGAAVALPLANAIRARPTLAISQYLEIVITPHSPDERSCGIIIEGAYAVCGDQLHVRARGRSRSSRAITPRYFTVAREVREVSRIQSAHSLPSSQLSLGRVLINRRAVSAFGKTGH